MTVHTLGPGVCSALFMWWVGLWWEMQEYAAKFYKSKTWQACRAGYAKSVGGLCEKCLARGEIRPGVIVHHKINITPDNIGRPEVTLNCANLELLCRDCHAQEHQKRLRRYKVDDMGRVISWPED